MNQDEKFMQLAINEAKKGRFHTWKNPQVGAVIVKNGQILATGYHHYYGGIHAERDVISKLTEEQLFNSTLYVTLEPCNHTGKQPPCSDLIVNSKIKRVVIAEIDPHSLVTGKGIKKLKNHQITVTSGVLAKEAENLNLHYNFYYQHGLPYITLKQAISLDYKASLPNKRLQITSQASYDLVHQERADYQAIMIGSSTALIDNPTLLTSVKQEHPPIRIIIDRRGRLDGKDLKIFSNQAPTWIFTEKTFTNPHPLVRIIKLKSASLKNILTYLGKKEVQSLYVEGGPQLLTSFSNEQLGQELITYLAPISLGKTAINASQMSNFNLSNITYQQLGQDIRIKGRINYV